MGLTLEELKKIRDHIQAPCLQYDCPAIKLLEREIKLKETDFVRDKRIVTYDLLESSDEVMQITFNQNGKIEKCQRKLKMLL